MGWLQHAVQSYPLYGNIVIRLAWPMTSWRCLTFDKILLNSLPSSAVLKDVGSVDSASRDVQPWCQRWMWPWKWRTGGVPGCLGGINAACYSVTQGPLPMKNDGSRSKGHKSEPHAIDIWILCDAPTKSRWVCQTQRKGECEFVKFFFS